MSVLIKTQRLTRILVNEIFNNNLCLHCGKKSALSLCKVCEKKLLEIDFDKPRCSKCGKKLISEIELCRECRESNEKTNIDKVFPIFAYRNWKKNLLIQWKIGKDWLLTPLFAECIAKVIREKHWENIPIVPVPPRPFKIYLKGADQIDELAKKLHSIYHFKICRVLKRTSNKEQKKLSHTERLTNIQSYKIRKPLQSECAILIDDIRTTGATTEACAKLLKDSGVKTVYVISLFSARS